MKLIYLLFLFVITIHCQSEVDQLINQLIDGLAKTIPALKKALDSSPSSQASIVANITKDGFTSFEQSGTIQKIIGVENSEINEFITTIASIMDLPSSYNNQLSSVITDVLWMSENQWVTFSVMFNASTGGSSKYVCLIGYNNATGQNTDWVIANIQSQFQLAPNIYAIKHCKKILWVFSDCSTQYVSQPSGLTEDETETIFDFFEIVAFERFQDLATPNSTKLVVANQALAAFNTALTIIKEVCSTWQSSFIFSFQFNFKKVVQAFKSSVSYSVKEILLQKGFSYFDQTADTQKIGDMEDCYVQDFLKLLATRFEIPAGQQGNFTDVLSDIIYEQSTDWSAYHVVFSKGTGGQVSYACVMMNHNTSTNTVNWLISDMQATFQLADNIMVIQKQLSVAGGIWQSTTFQLKYIPASLTEADIQEVFDFFYFLGMKSMGQLLGLNITLPNLGSSEDQLFLPK